jgi:hypothetical protein
MRFFLDTEFIESGPFAPIQLVSIGIVSELGNEFYAVSSQFDAISANDWVRVNVLPHLGIAGTPLSEIRSKVLEFIEENALHNSDGTKSRFDSGPEFWGYYADYDWVVFCQIFGAMIDLPKGWPLYCRDLKQWCDALGNPKLPDQISTEHNALNDARWNRRIYDFLKERKSSI